MNHTLSSVTTITISQMRDYVSKVKDESKMGCKQSSRDSDVSISRADPSSSIMLAFQPQPMDEIR
jgi:hypothetical protein